MDEHDDNMESNFDYNECIINRDLERLSTYKMNCIGTLSKCE